MNETLDSVVTPFTTYEREKVLKLYLLFTQSD